jgi:hypothetical protein
VDRSQQIFPALDDLRQIQFEALQSSSLDDLRDYFERVQALRRANPDNFDLQLLVAEVQEQIIEHARLLRDGTHSAAQNGAPRTTKATPKAGPPVDIPEEVQKLDSKTWQRATYLALFFAAILFAAFFYLVQTARRLNFTPNEQASQQTQRNSKSPAEPLQNASASGSAPPVSMNPTVRLYTDLIPGTVTIDDSPSQDLKDGELVLDSLQPGQHSIRVAGRSGNAAFTFDVQEKTAPRVVGLPASSNAMTVLVSEQDGKARLVTSAGDATVSLDGKSVGTAGTDGLELNDLGKADHDLQVTQGKDRQRFVLTYTAAPVLTVYVKSDPNAGTVVVVTGQDGVEVYINDALYRRKTDRGQVRIPLKVGEYTIRVHKNGFIDPPPETVTVTKAEESAVEFRMQAAPDIATLQVSGALPGTMVYVDKDFAAAIGADGNAKISNVKPGDHTIELRRNQALPKRFERTFRTGDVVMLSGPDVTLDPVITENKPAPPPAAPPPAPTNSTTPNYSMEIPGEQVRHGSGLGFVPYHTPKVPGHYSFQAQARVGGFFKKGKLQWYAGYLDSLDYVLFTLDGKHATIREVHDGKSTEVNRIPFNVDSNQWVQVDLAVRPNEISARVKTPESGWNEVGAVTSTDHDFTQGRVGFYIPGNDAVAVSDFRFSNH